MLEFLLAIIVETKTALLLEIMLHSDLVLRLLVK